MESYTNNSKTITYDVLSVTEHWLKNDEIDCSAIGNKIVASSFCRRHHKGGGALIYLNESMPYKNLMNLVNKSVEKVCEIAAVYLTGYDLYVINVYRSPQGCFNDFLNTIESVFINVDSSKNILFTGDLNINFNQQNETNVQGFIQLMKQFGLKQHIKEPTRMANCIDNVLTNIESRKIITNVKDTTLSDHKAIHVKIQLSNTLRINNFRTQRCRPITQQSCADLYNRLQHIDWSFTEKGRLSADEKFDNMMIIIQQQFEETFPMRPLKYRNDTQIHWFNSRLKQIRETLQLITEVHQKSPDENILKRLKKNYKKYYEHEITIEKMKANEIFVQKAKNVSKATWELINSMKIKKRIKVSKDLNGNDINNYFLNKTKEIKDSLILPNHKQRKFKEFF